MRVLINDIKEAIIFVIRKKWSLEVDIESLKWLSCLDEMILSRLFVPLFVLITDFACISHFFDLFNRVQ